MTRYLLDTSALIDFALGREPIRSRLLEILSGPDDVAVSAVQVAEFFSGLSPAERSTWSTFLETVMFWQINQAAARQAGIYRYDFARRGVSLSTPDVLIAALAREQGAIVVTNNGKDFPMADVKLLVLRPETPQK